jgi:hypothetical protein
MATGTVLIKRSGPDPAIVKDQLAALQQMHAAWGVEHFMMSLFWILTKQKQKFTSGKVTSLVPFRFNWIQHDIEMRLGERNILVKARQIGGTTYMLLRRLFVPAILDHGIGSLLISQNNEYVTKHFSIARRAYRYIGAVDPYDARENIFSISLRQNLLHTEASNRREIIFDQLDSRVIVASAEVEESGQGITLHHILADEYSRWPGSPADTLSNVEGALVPDGTLDKNCTANGAAGPFYEDVMRVLNTPKDADAVLHFYPWYWTDEYRRTMTAAEAEELKKDLTEEERRLIGRFHKELKSVAWIKNKRTA